MEREWSADILSASGQSPLSLSRRISLARFVRAARSGGHDVRAPPITRKHDFQVIPTKSLESMTTKSSSDAIFTPKFKTGLKEMNR
jgi:hypothetical protein